MTFLSALPQGLRTDVEIHLKCQILDKIPLFKDLDSTFIEEVALNLKPDVYTPLEFIFRAGQKSDKMYFVIKGQLVVLKEDGTIIDTLKEGNFFGEIALLNNQDRSASVQAITYCDLYLLEKEVFDYLLERFPDIGAHIKEVAHQRQENDNRSLTRESRPGKARETGSR
jgi:CRP-like cAMP-binding protein